jgi:hypothetical protein
MDRDKTLIELPDKLYTDLYKGWDEHRAAFISLVDALAVKCPNFTLKSQHRYSAFYQYGRPYVFVDPQKRRILFGFFADYISDIRDHIQLGETKIPPWNKSKGGLIGYSLEGFDDELKLCVTDIESLILESYRTY